VQGLSHQDGPGDAKVRLAGDERCATKVRTCAHALENGRKGDETRSATNVSQSLVDRANSSSENDEADVDVHISIRKHISASLIRRHARRLQGRGQSLHVRLLVESNVLKVIVVIDAISGILKVLLGEVGEGAFVEDILQVLERQSELEDGGVDITRLATGWVSESMACQDSCQGEEGSEWTHIVLERISKVWNE
jgi:hypothetical protein